MKEGAVVWETSWWNYSTLPRPNPPDAQGGKTGTRLVLFNVYYDRKYSAVADLHSMTRSVRFWRSCCDRLCETVRGCDVEGSIHSEKRGANSRKWIS
jgi:hypothetical protein